MQFIPDQTSSSNMNNTTAAEGVAVDNAGNIYGAEVSSRMLRKYLVAEEK